LYAYWLFTASKKKRSDASFSITQAELAGLVDQHRAAYAAALSLRRRVEEGAPIEPGALHTTTEGEYNPIRDCDYEPSGLLLVGLELHARRTTRPRPRVVSIGDRSAAAQEVAHA